MICSSRQDDTCPVSPSKARGEEGHHKPESNSGVAKMSSPHNQLLLSRVAVEAGQEGEAVLTPEQEVVVLVVETVSSSTWTPSAALDQAANRPQRNQGTQ